MNYLCGKMHDTIVSVSNNEIVQNYCQGIRWNDIDNNYARIIIDDD